MVLLGVAGVGVIGGLLALATIKLKRSQAHTNLLSLSCPAEMDVTTELSRTEQQPGLKSVVLDNTKTLLKLNQQQQQKPHSTSVSKSPLKHVQLEEAQNVLQQKH
ncbi:unnamed protein product [Didymodactylos carnosus]|uniref:Uncharacterized protein n=1 Tax=Didymodactylos carnosus TaxID=1234261 RepID=A0A814GPR0_9BILA|nr:unnamed protein product [Didymodactylos carnosus]CAF0999103.1 unnamed protein product [Didymodactylos carnosus]CAF3685191.1 unnamed protein product [Didymodactylos carnosus]CAF3770592.1 unnamed protein product [Didymodactylos carnosus]